MANEDYALPSVVEMQVKHVERHVRRVVEALHALADSVQREADMARDSAVHKYTDVSCYAVIAARVTHQIQWGVANLPLGQLVTDAAQADVYAERAKTSSEA